MPGLGLEEKSSSLSIRPRSKLDTPETLVGSKSEIQIIHFYIFPRVSTDLAGFGCRFGKLRARRVAENLTNRTPYWHNGNSGRTTPQWTPKLIRRGPSQPLIHSNRDLGDSWRNMVSFGHYCQQFQLSPSRPFLTGGNHSMNFKLS